MAGPRWWTSVRGRPSYRGPASVPVIPPPSACRQRSPLLTTPHRPLSTGRRPRPPRSQSPLGEQVDGLVVVAQVVVAEPQVGQMVALALAGVPQMTGRLVGVQAT